MQTVLFHEIIFGPIHSRRLGISLGVNLLPVDGKLCSFDCVYCECGYNAQGVGKSGLPSSDRVEEELKSRLQSMHEAGEKLDVITFAGNGEPTLHPEFEKIIDTTLYLRDHYYPEAKISVLSNATRIHDESVFRALNRVDLPTLGLPTRAIMGPVAASMEGPPCSAPVRGVCPPSICAGVEVREKGERAQPSPHSFMIGQTPCWQRSVPSVHQGSVHPQRTRSCWQQVFPGPAGTIGPPPHRSRQRLLPEKW